MTKRVSCHVVFCRRTRAADGAFNEWICGRHWFAVDRRLRRLRARNRRRIPFLRGPALQRALAREQRLWQWCKRQASERALLGHRAPRSFGNPFTE